MSEVGPELPPIQNPRPQLREIFEKDWRDPQTFLVELGVEEIRSGPEKETPGAFDNKGSFKSAEGDVYGPGDKRVGHWLRRDWKGPGPGPVIPARPDREWIEVFVYITRPGETETVIEVSAWLDPERRVRIINREEHRPGQPVRSWTASREFDEAGKVVRASKVDSEKGLGGEDVNRSQEEEYRPDGTLLSSKEKHYKVRDGNHVIRINEAGVNFGEGGTPTHRWERRFDPQTGEEIVAGSSKADQKLVVLQRTSAGSTSNSASSPASEKPARQSGIRGLINRLAGR